MALAVGVCVGGGVYGCVYNHKRFITFQSHATFVFIKELEAVAKVGAGLFINI